MECYVNMFSTTVSVHSSYNRLLPLIKNSPIKKSKERQTFSPTFYHQDLTSHPPRSTHSLLPPPDRIHGLTLVLRLLVFGLGIHISPISIQPQLPVLSSRPCINITVLRENLNVIPALAPDSARAQGVRGTELLLVAALGSCVSTDRFA